MSMKEEYDPFEQELGRLVPRRISNTSRAEIGAALDHETAPGEAGANLNGKEAQVRVPLLRDRWIWWSVPAAALLVMGTVTVGNTWHPPKAGLPDPGKKEGNQSKKARRWLRFEAQSPLVPISDETRVQDRAPALHREGWYDLHRDVMVEILSLQKRKTPDQPVLIEERQLEQDGPPIREIRARFLDRQKWYLPERDVEVEVIVPREMVQRVRMDTY